MSKQQENKKAKKRGIKNAEFYTDSIKMAVITIADVAISNGENTPDVKTLYKEIGAQADRALDGSITACVTMLTAQAMTLDMLYNKMISKVAHANTLKVMQVSMDMALRLQNQCRKTLLGICALTHPQQAIFVKQQNVAFNQQVNNGLPPNGSQPEISKLKSENELISEAKHAALDTGRTLTTSAINQNSKALEMVNRCEDSQR